MADEPVLKMRRLSWGSTYQQVVDERRSRTVFLLIPFINRAAFLRTQLDRAGYVAAVNTATYCAQSMRARWKNKLPECLLSCVRARLFHRPLAQQETDGALVLNHRFFWTEVGTVRLWGLMMVTEATWAQEPSCGLTPFLGPTCAVQQGGPATARLLSPGGFSHLRLTLSSRSNVPALKQASGRRHLAKGLGCSSCYG